MAVIGLERFRERFRAHVDCYVLIGGTACFLAMDRVGVAFRSTKDLDIVLMTDAVDRGFAHALWDFIKAGGYEIRESTQGRRRFYRFAKPTVDGFPAMLELFSRASEGLELYPGQQVIPITAIDETGDALSLSAILLDRTYYDWIRAGRVVDDGLSYVRAEHVVPLKARAWIDLTARRRAGETIDDRDIKKHRNDVFRLQRILDPRYAPAIPPAIADHLGSFLAAMAAEAVDLQALGCAPTTTLAEVVQALRSLYRGDRGDGILV